MDPGIFPGGICPTGAGFGMSVQHRSRREEKMYGILGKGWDGGGLWDLEVGRGSC